MAQKADPQVLAHLEWLGYVQPTGLVVSAHAMISAGAVLDRADAEGQRQLRASVAETTGGTPDESVHVIPDFAAFARDVLGWSLDPRFYAGTAGSPIPDDLESYLPEHGESLRPDLAVREPDGSGTGWQLLVSVVDQSADLDRAYRSHGSLEASPHSRLERLLRDKGVLAGLLTNGKTIRLIAAPRGETSGWIDFRVEDMLPTAGRPICSALRLLLGQTRLLALPRHQRLPALLEESRKYQGLVSERLAEQVLHALYELVRGFQAAHEASKGTLLRSQLESHPDEVYRGLLNVILRLVFLLYAEERGMFPDVETWGRFYALGGLHARLREDAARYPDTMDQRYGAWAQLLALFRLVHGGADLGFARIPARHGVIFDPSRFPFLEGRQASGQASADDRIDVPLVSDGTVFRAIEKLLVLDGERISYRALDVEQIGSVYETMMGFRLETATGQSLAIRAEKRGGAPTTVDLDALLGTAQGERAKRLTELTGRKFTDRVALEVRSSTSVEALYAALLGVADLDAAPDIVPRGSLILQPSDERRKSGSHYTPKSLTEPIVKRALEPVLAKLAGPGGLSARPTQILDLKVCDPAMGSGAFLVEACRQLADSLITAWGVHGGRPSLPTDEDEVIFARRIVAQRCLYGVDRNPMAADLAKVSLWLVTLAREHPLTFLDHALRHGDSLVGLRLDQVESFHWQAEGAMQRGFESLRIRAEINRARGLRDQIRDTGDTTSDTALFGLWSAARDASMTVCEIGDLALASYFAEDSASRREALRTHYAGRIAAGGLAAVAGDAVRLRGEDPNFSPFHWELEFPEVFDRPNHGFDVVVGNPPFMKGGAISTNLGTKYRDYLLMRHVGSHGNGDLVAFFFRAVFELLRDGGSMGLIATKTIAQGDTRTTGLYWIRKSGGVIYSATRRLRWPGAAAVTVSTVHVSKGPSDVEPLLDGAMVPLITAYLLDRGTDEPPVRLAANSGISYEGSKVYGQGFVFADGDLAASPISEMTRLLNEDPRNADRIFPYVSGSEVNSRPDHHTDRYVIDFRSMSLAEAAAWPELLDIVRRKVKPERDLVKRHALRDKWWIHGEHRPGLYAAIAGMSHVIVNSKVSQWLLFTRVNTGSVYSHNLNVFALSSLSSLAALQSRCHELWVGLTSSTLEDRTGYRPTDCFETYPFPVDWTRRPELEAAGRDYFEFRAAHMMRASEGLTATYNRFHDPADMAPDIVELRKLHDALDGAMLKAYGWEDITAGCDFYPDRDPEDTLVVGLVRSWRYRWSDELGETVLARLLELNAARAKEEERAGSGGRKQRSAGRKAPLDPTGMDTLFG